MYVHKLTNQITANFEAYTNVTFFKCDKTELIYSLNTSGASTIIYNLICMSLYAYTIVYLKSSLRKELEKKLIF